ncbi:MAG: WHG domain-containing protein, partial [Microthrixaceae bacterium]
HAIESPALFHLMLRYPPRPVAGVDAFPPATRAFEAAAAATAEAIDSGQLAVDDPALASMTMWAAIHGVAEVLLLGFVADREQAEVLVDSVIDTVLAGQIHPLDR